VTGHHQTAATADITIDAGLRLAGIDVPDQKTPTTK